MPLERSGGNREKTCWAEQSGEGGNKGNRRNEKRKLVVKRNCGYNQEKVNGPRVIRVKEKAGTMF